MSALPSLNNGVEEIKKYYKSPRISNSYLSAALHPRLLKARRDNPELLEDTAALRKGSAIDCLLTSPARWEEDFKVLNVNKPFGLMGKFIDELPKELTPFHGPEHFESAYWKSGYKMPLTWVINKFWTTPDAVEYYDAVNVKSDVTILSKDEYESVMKAKELVLVSPFAFSYFIPNRTYDELLHQVPIYFTYKGREFKALLDGIKIDHKHKTIQPFDLKSTGKSVFHFKDSLLQYGYYRQAALYEIAIHCPESPVYSLIQEGYTVLDFIFVVVETNIASMNPAIIFETTPHLRKAGIEGGTCDGVVYKGINQLLEDLEWYEKNDEWTYPREVFQNNGTLILDIFDKN